MNWKEQPHLFKGFQVVKSTNKFSSKFTIESIIEVDGTIWVGEYYNLVWDESHFDGLKVEDCILIARKISDMSDEERKEYDQWLSYDDYGCPFESTDAFLYALSVGCLPEYFEWNETVIDIKTL